MKKIKLTEESLIQVVKYLIPKGYSRISYLLVSSGIFLLVPSVRDFVIIFLFGKESELFNYLQYFQIIGGLFIIIGLAFYSIFFLLDNRKKGTSKIIKKSVKKFNNQPPEQVTKLGAEEINIANTLFANDLSPTVKLVVFDLDGTLIHGDGFEYSWKSIWEYLGLSDLERKKYYVQYVEEGTINYEEWCEICLEKFKAFSITRSDIEKISSRLSLIKNFDFVIKELKSKGVKLAIVSGGIDTFLEFLVPNYLELFDRLYINKFVYGEGDKLTEVVPTEYDFNNKVNAIFEMCDEWGINPHNVAFVGEGRNDRFVFKAMKELEIEGRIALPSKNNKQDMETLAKHQFDDEDLSSILNVIDY